MKKILTFAACAVIATATQAASVGWTLAGASNYVGDAYKFFIIGQNGAETIATVTALLDAGTDVSAYQFGAGTIGSNGAGSAAATLAGQPTLDTAGTYTAFFVVFDSASPTAGESNYTVVSGQSTMTKTTSASSATVAFTTGNVSTYLNTASNWKSYGAVPEPTSGLLMLLGVAGLALRRRRA